MPAGMSVEIENIRKLYHTRRGEDVEALSEVSTSIQAGEFVSVVGPSGCGKSTMMMLVSGLIKPSAGRIMVDHEMVTRPRSGVGIVFQRDVLLEWRSVLDNVLLPIEIKHLSRAAYVDKARDLLRLVGLEGFEAKYPSELSGGMRQRVAICRALVQEPGLLLMDEPFGALDALTREQMNVDLQRMWSLAGNTVVFITHSIEEAVFLSDRVLVMSPRPGRVVADLQVDLDRPRGSVARKDSKLVGLVDHIRHLFQVHGVLSEK